MKLGSGIAAAVAVANSCSTDSTPSLGISICRGCGPKKKDRKKKNTLSLKKEKNVFIFSENNIRNQMKKYVFYKNSSYLSQAAGEFQC